MTSFVCLTDFISLEISLTQHRCYFWQQHWCYFRYEHKISCMCICNYKVHSKQNEQMSINKSEFSTFVSSMWQSTMGQIQKAWSTVHNNLIYKHIPWRHWSPLYPSWHPKTHLPLNLLQVLLTQCTLQEYRQSSPKDSTQPTFIDIQKACSLKVN